MSPGAGWDGLVPPCLPAREAYPEQDQQNSLSRSTFFASCGED